MKKYFIQTSKLEPKATHVKLDNEICVKRGRFTHNQLCGKRPRLPRQIVENQFSPTLRG